MEMQLSGSEREEQRKLQRNLCGSFDHARVTCLLIPDKGYKLSAVSECLGINVSTVCHYRFSYLHGGVDELLGNRHKDYWGMLDGSRLAALQKELREHIYTDAKSVRAWIKAAFGVEYTSQGVVDLLNRIGFTYKKTSEVPCETDASLQEAFVDELTETLGRMEEGSIVYYSDAPAIYIISDNARCYHNKDLWKWVEGTKIKQIFLPPYSPNLNLMERLWKFLRIKVINTGFYRSKEDFRQAIKRFFDNMGTFKEELESLITLNFRLCNLQSISF